MRVNNSNQIEYEKKFNNKINIFQNHSKYSWLREYSDDALRFHTGFGFYAIKAIDFMDHIIEKSVEDIEGWLNGENNLEW